MVNASLQNAVASGEFWSFSGPAPRRRTECDGDRRPGVRDRRAGHRPQSDGPQRHRLRRWDGGVGDEGGVGDRDDPAGISVGVAVGGELFEVDPEFAQAGLLAQLPLGVGRADPRPSNETTGERGLAPERVDAPIDRRVGVRSLRTVRTTRSTATSVFVGRAIAVESTRCPLLWCS